MGRLIPAGTGLHSYRGISVKSEAQEQMMEEEAGDELPAVSAEAVGELT